MIKVLVCLKPTSQNFPSLNIMNQYMLCVHIKSNVIKLNNKSGGICGKFSEDYPKCGRFYKTIKMPLLYYKRRRLRDNVGEL